MSTVELVNPCFAGRAEYNPPSHPSVNRCFAVSSNVRLPAGGAESIKLYPYQRSKFPAPRQTRAAGSGARAASLASHDRQGPKGAEQSHSRALWQIQHSFKLKNVLGMPKVVKRQGANLVTFDGNRIRVNQLARMAAYQLSH